MKTEFAAHILAARNAAKSVETALNCKWEEAAWERLARYEDTGLYPESVEAIKLSMMGKAISEITEFDGLPIDRLRELADADKDGRVVVLPDVPEVERWDCMM